MFSFTYQNQFNIARRFLTICLLATSIEISFLPIYARVLAEETKISYTLNFTPPNRGRVSGNGTQKPRRTAARNPGNLRAIVPQIGSDPILQRPIYEGLTISSHPVFWLSYEEQTDSNIPIIIHLEIRDTQTNGKKYYYQDSFSFLTNSPSQNLSIKLPQAASPLASNTRYQWKFLASKEGKLVGETVGYIEKVEISSEANNKLLNSNLRQKAEIYAQWGIWHELLETIERLKQENPGDTLYENVWNNLMYLYL